MKRVPAYYSQAYAPAAEPLLARLQTTRDLLVQLDLVEIHEARTLDPSLLDGLHDPVYTRAFLEGTEPMASQQGIRWSPAVRDATLAILGGQVQAAEHALANQCVTLNIARGFHHAHPAGGSGFCALNGLALLAHRMPERRVLVIDCDEHGGNGTEEFAAILPNLHAVSIFGTRFGCRGGTRSWAFHVTREEGYAHYSKALDEALALADDIAPDLVIYQAGADCHREDPKSQLKLSTDELMQRDLHVLRGLARRSLPVLITLAGGYQAARRVARLNANTMRAALEADGAR